MRNKMVMKIMVKKRGMACKPFIDIQKLQKSIKEENSDC